MKGTIVAALLLSALLSGIGGAALGGVSRSHAESENAGAAESPRAEKGDDERANAPSPTLQLKGISTDAASGSKAIIHNRATGATDSYAVGDTVPKSGGATVTGITREEVDLTGDDRTFTLALRGEEGKRPKGRKQRRRLSDTDLISLELDNTDIRYVIKMISDLTGTNFVLSDQVRGTVTLMTPEKISGDGLMTILASILDMRNLAMVPDGKIVRIVPKREAIKSAGVPVLTDASAAPPPTASIVTRVIPLKHVSPDAILREIMVFSGRDASLVPDSDRSAIIITDTPANIDRIMRIIDTLDRPPVEGSSGSHRVGIRDLIAGVSAATGKKFVVNPGVDGAVTLYSPETTSGGYGLDFLKTALAAKGYLMKEQGDYIAVMPDPEGVAGGKTGKSKRRTRKTK